MFFKKIKPRKFEYIPRFYDPSKDKDRLKQNRINFGKRNSKKRSSLIWLILLIIVLYFYIRLDSLSKKKYTTSKKDTIDQELIDSVKKYIPKN